MNTLQRHKVIAVTGGASGIGLAICRRFGSVGFRVAIIDMNTDEASCQASNLRSLGIEAASFTCDVGSENQCVQTINAVIDTFGGIDILVNNAGITQRSAFTETQTSVYRKVMDVNFFGALYCTKAAIKSLIDRRGVIVVTSSHAGYAPLLGRTGYSASKHALHGLFESLRAEIKNKGVHVMMVCPGFTKTNLQTRALDGDGSVSHHPQSKVGKEDTAENVANAVYQGVIKRKNLLVLTPTGKFTYFLTRLAPGLYERIMAKMLKDELIRQT
ncbi:MAG TPA: SDR family oxidoreductase [Smithellaceae bacterium]|nr:SDR family oxidoreductase [Smithellaceae bacterium]HRS89937.1 SDR family oxidoreductase [Smithellaceae bacterium]HRV26774.1 SDR family oxidoreductase [Smithellaceae bacterium]